MDSVVQARERFFGRRIGEFAVEVVMEPASVGLVQFVGCDLRRTIVPLQRAENRQRIEQYARRIDCNAEFGLGEPSADRLREARTECQHAVGMRELPGVGPVFDFGAEFHAAKVRIFVNCLSLCGNFLILCDETIRK